MGGFFTGVKIHRGDAETLRKTRCGEVMGGIGGRAGIETVHCWTGGFESAETAEIAETKTLRARIVAAEGR
jgi:hypothetical protein